MKGPSQQPERASHTGGRPPRILYVTDGFAPFVVGGMQAVARRQIETLVGAGFKVVSISSNDDGKPTDLDWRNISIPWPKRSLGRQLSPYRYVTDLKLFSAQVVQVIDEMKPDCIYSEGPLLHDYLVRPRITRVPTIYHPHGLEMFQHKGSLIEDLKSMPMCGITRVHACSVDVVISQSRRGQLLHILEQKCGTDPARIFTMPNAVSLDQGLAPAAKTAPQGGRFLFIGRNEPRKGVPLLLKAFKDVPGATLDLVGVDLPHPQSAHIRAHGEVRDRARVLSFFQAADFVVVPSFAEGMPTVILEAFAQAVPVIATDVGASADLVRTGETGFLIEPGNFAALRGAVEQAMTLTADDYVRLSSNCLEVARTTYAPETIQRQLIGLINGLVERERQSND